MLPKGTLAHRVTIASATLLGAVAVSGAVLVWTAIGLRSAQQRQTEVFTVARQSTTDLLGAYVDQETGLRGYVITGQSTFLAPYTAAQPRIPAIIARLRTVTGPVPGASDRLAAVRSAYDDWDRYAAAQLAQVATGDRTEQQARRPPSPARPGSTPSATGSATSKRYCIPIRPRTRPSSWPCSNGWSSCSSPACSS